MNLQGVLDDLTVGGVLDVILDGHNDGLVHLVADDQTNAALSQCSFHCVVSSLRVLLVENRHHASDVMLDLGDLVGVLKLVDCVLEAEVKELCLEILKHCFKLCTCLISEFCCLHSLSLHFFVELLFCCEAALDRKLVHCETHSLTSNFLSNTVHLEENSAGLNYCYPVFR